LHRFSRKSHASEFVVKGGRQDGVCVFPAQGENHCIFQTVSGGNWAQPVNSRGYWGGGGGKEDKTHTRGWQQVYGGSRGERSGMKVVGMTRGCIVREIFLIQEKGGDTGKRGVPCSSLSVPLVSGWGRGKGCVVRAHIIKSLHWGILENCSGRRGKPTTSTIGKGAFRLNGGEKGFNTRGS